MRPGFLKNQLTMPDSFEHYYLPHRESNHTFSKTTAPTEWQTRIKRPIFSFSLSATSLIRCAMLTFCTRSSFSWRALCSMASWEKIPWASSLSLPRYSHWPHIPIQSNNCRAPSLSISWPFDAVWTSITKLMLASCIRLCIQNGREEYTLNKSSCRRLILRLPIYP
jgi:hypothetical protein